MSTDEQPPPHAILVQWGKFKAGVFGIPAIIVVAIVAAAAVALKLL